VAVLSADIAVLLHHNAMDTRTDCSVVSTVLRGNGGPACRYSCTVSSQCNGHIV